MKVNKLQKETEEADELGESYLRSKEQIDALFRQQDSRKNKIKIFTSKAASQTVIGRETLVFGKRFAVGFLTTDGTKAVNYKRLFKLMPAIEKKVCRFVPVEELVEKAVRSGILPRKILVKCLVPVGKPQERVVVKDLSKKGKNEGVQEG